MSKWCNPLISYQEILIFQGKFPSFNKTLTFYEHFLNKPRVVSTCKEQKQEENKMNEVLYAIEYLLRSLTWVDAVIFCLAVVGVVVVFRLFKAKQDKIEDYLDDKE